MSRIGCLLLLLWLLPAVQAVEVGGLYDAEVPVSGQSPEEREEAVRNALAAVLIKVTGDRGVVGGAQLYGVFQQADRFVEQYRYRDVALTATPPVGQPGVSQQTGEPPVQTKLWVAFDAAAVNRMLEEQRLPVWGSTRPLVLVWLAVQDGSNRYLIDPEHHQSFREEVEAGAAQRGVPVVFPLLDLEDRANISLSDVWGNFADRILEASQRYRADAVLVGRVHRLGASQWSGRWALYLNNRAIEWETNSPGLSAALRTGIDANADAMAARFAQVFSADVGERLLVAVDGIDNFPAYSRALRYLASLNPVSAAHVLSVDGQRVTFDLSIRGTQAGLEQLISLGKVLGSLDAFQIRPLSDDPVGGASVIADTRDAAVYSAPEPDLAYRILP